MIYDSQDQDKKGMIKHQEPGLQITRHLGHESLA